MGYSDFWFVDKRVQTNNLKRWFLWGILLFAFVSVGVTVGVKSMYQPFTNYAIQAETLQVSVEEAKKTNANGYIKGTIKNDTNEEIQGKYLKIEFYTKNNVNIGNEYIEVGTLRSMQTKTYEVKFRYSNVESAKITITENKE